MLFYDTLKDKNVKALFPVIAESLYRTQGKSQREFLNSLTFDQRVHTFRIVHNCMKALGIPGWQEPTYLNDPSHTEADA